MTVVDIEALDHSVQEMRKLTEDLKDKAGMIQAVERNVDRILADIKMLELNISDVKEFIKG